MWNCTRVFTIEIKNKKKLDLSFLIAFRVYFIYSSFKLNRKISEFFRGENAFCSLECRQQQMNQDERKEKCSLTSMKKEVASSTVSETGTNGERVAAAS